MNNQDDRNEKIDDFQILTEFLGPFDDIESALDSLSNHVSTALLIEAQQFGRSPLSVSHDLIKLEDGYYVSVVEVTQAGLLASPTAQE